MKQKRIITVITITLSILCLCAGALLLCNRGKGSTTNKDKVANNYAHIYQKDLGLSIPINEDWAIIGQNIERTKTDYSKMSYKSYDECIEELKKSSIYLQTNSLEDCTCLYYISGITEMTPEAYAKLSKEERKKTDDNLLQTYVKDCGFDLKSTEYCNINNNVWCHAISSGVDDLLSDEIYLGIINNHLLLIDFMYETSLSNEFSPAALMNSITIGQVSAPATSNPNFLEQVRESLQLKNLPLWVFGVVLLLILLFGLKLAKPKEFFDDCMSLKVAKGIQGLAALGIVFHHLVQQLSNANLTGISFFSNIGVLFVGIFFFFSGYGLLLSYKTKENYLHNFLKKRLPIILLPFFLSSWIYIIAKIMNGESIGTGRLLQLVSTFKLPNTNAWYVVELFILYLVFYFTFRFIKNKNVAYAINGVFSVVLILGSLLLGHSKTGEDWFKGEWWFNSTLLFFVGMTYAKFRTRLLPVIKRFYWVLLPGFTAAFGLLYHFTTNQLATGGYWTETETSMAYMDKFATLALQLPMIICFIIALLLFTMKVQIGNRFIRFIGTFTLELYLMQNLFIGYLKDAGHISNYPLYIIAAFVLSIATGWALHRLCHNITGLFHKHSKESPLDSKASGLVPGIARNKYIDVFRLIMCFLVVCIHIPFPGEAGRIIIAYGKTAVPFFLVVSGYLCYREEPTIFGTRLKKQGVRLLSLTVWANLFYALVFYLRNGAEAFTTALTDDSLFNFIFLNESPYASHLWFLGSLVVAIGIMLLLNKLKVASKVIYVFPILLAIYFLSWRLDGNMEHMLQYRNAIACTLSYFMAGCVLRKHETFIMKYFKPAAAIITAALLFAAVAVEYTLCKNTAIPYISAELLTFAIVMLCMVCSKVQASTAITITPTKTSSLAPSQLGRNYSLDIYIWHVAILGALQTWLGEANHVLTTVGPVVVFLITLLLSYLLSIGKNIIGKRATTK